MGCSPAVPLVVAVAAVACLAPAARAQSLEISSAAGRDARVAAAIESLTVRATVEEGVALVDLDQTFRNGMDAVQEGVWTIRLPEDAVVHSLSMWMDGKEKRGRVHEAGIARATYDSIVRSRRDPALLEEVGWRTFRVSVFPIPARDVVRIRLVYAHVVPDDLGLHSLRVPLPASRVGVVDVSVGVVAPAGLGVCDAPGAEEARIVAREDGATFRWSREGFTPKGPFEARFAPRTRGFGLSMLAHRETGDPQGSFVVRVVPHLESAPDLPRDVVFVVDRSGSMQGRKMAQAIEALVHGLGTLRAEDRFAVVSFASDVVSGAIAAANADEVAAARRSARLLEATGGTDIDGALRAALALRGDDPERLFVVVLLTDGDPTAGETQPDRIVANWRDAGGSRVRLFALGVGDDVKDFLLTRLARGSRGAAEYVRQEEKLEAKLSDLFEKVRAPLLTDPEISVEGVPVVSVEPRPLPDVFRGGAVVLAGRFVEGGKATLVLRGKQGKAPVEVRVPVEFPTAPVARPHVAQLWARMRIDRLLDDLRTAGSSAEIRREITDLGVRHQVVSPFTSFLVVEDGVRVADEAETVRVPDLPPPESGGPTSGGGGGPTTGGGPGRSTGHGGSYRGPSGEVPPDSREPSDPPPRDDERRPTGSGAHALGGGARSGGTPPGDEHWRLWWDAEADFLLAGMGRPAAPPLDPRFVAAEILPALRKAFDDPAGSQLVRAEVLEALARFGERDAAFLSRVEALQREGSDARDRSADRAVVERALLAPLWLGDRSEETRGRLLAVVADGSRAPSERSFAAITLGLLGERGEGRVVRTLLAAVREPAGRDPGVSSYLCALGLLGDPAATEPLLSILDTAHQGADPAYVVDALGRIGSAGPSLPDGRSALVRRLLDLSESRDMPVRRIVPRALERLFPEAGALDRTKIVEILRAVAGDDDLATSGAALIALGRLAGSADLADGQRRPVLQTIRTYAASRSVRRQEYAALALGLAANGPARDEVVTGLRGLLTSKSAETQLREAAAAALGLARDGASSPALLALARDRGLSAGLRGAAALAAACCGSKDVDETVTDLFADHWSGRGGRWDALRAIATSADPADLPLVLDWARRAGDPADCHRIAEALGRMGDEDAVHRLLASSGRDGQHLLPPRFAVRALGRMASRGDDPLDRLCDGFPYRHGDPSLAALRILAEGR